MQILLSPHQLELTINRLAHHLTENHPSLDDLVFIGIQPRGVKLSNKLVEAIRQIRPNENLAYGILDITFYRDDIRDELHKATKTDIPFSIGGKNVILIDDVLYTGRTIRAALDALQDFGRPKKSRIVCSCKQEVQPRITHSTGLLWKNDRYHGFPEGKSGVGEE